MILFEQCNRHRIPRPQRENRSDGAQLDMSALSGADEAARRALAVFNGDVNAAAKSLGVDSPALIRVTTAAVPKNPRPQKTRGRPVE